MHIAVIIGAILRLPSVEILYKIKYRANAFNSIVSITPIINPPSDNSILDLTVYNGTQKIKPIKREKNAVEHRQKPAATIPSKLGVPAIMLKEYLSNL